MKFVRKPGNVCLGIFVIIIVISQSLFADTLESRRQYLLDMLSDPGIFPVRHNFTSASYHSREWQFYHASLAKGIRIEEANHFFATMPVQNNEWLSLMLLTTFCRFKDILSSPAKVRMREIILLYANKLYRRNLAAITKVNHENHIINWKVIYLLANQEFGLHDTSHVKEAESSFNKWVQYRAKRGMQEFNSPHYIARSLHPLLLMYDF